MAFQSYFPQQEDKNKLGQGGSAVISAGGGPTGPSKTGGAAQTTGSGFVNLDKYLSANAGQSQGLADTLTGGYQDKASSSTSAVEDLNKQAQKEVSDKTKAQQTGQLVDQSGKAQTGGNVQQWAQGASDIIGGNYNYGLSDQTQANINQTIQEQEKIKGELGQLGDRNYQQAAFRRQFNPQGTYTQGFGALDTFLLNADPASRQQIEQTKQLAGGLNYDPISGETIRGYEDKAAAEFAANQGKISTAAGDLQRGYVDKYKQAEQQAAYENALLDEKYNVLQEYLNYISNRPGEMYSGKDLSGLVSKQGDFAAGNYFADQDAADLAALNQLLGTEQQFNADKREGSVGIDYDKLRGLSGPTGNWEFDYDPRTNEVRRRFVNYESGPQNWSSANISELDPGLAAYIQGRGY